VGSIEKYWIAAGVRFRARYRRPDGSQTDKRGFITQRDAEDFLALTKASLLTGAYRDPASARITIGALGPSWLDAQIQLKPSSFAVLEVAWRIHVKPRWGHVQLRDIRFSDIQRWIVALSEAKSATVVIRAHGVLAGILEFAVRDHRIDDNAARGINLPRRPLRPHRYLNHVQVELLAREAGPNSTVVNLLAYTGLRWGELVALTVGSVDLIARRLRIEANAVNVRGTIHPGSPKSHALRTVPYPGFLADEIIALCGGRQAHQLLFGGGTKFLPTPTPRNGWFAGARGRAVRRDPSIPPNLTLHDLRHTAASLAVSAGANVKAVQRMLGHASAAMTLDVYADLFETDLTDVALRLDARRDAMLGLARPEH
jgi:integrase